MPRNFIVIGIDFGTTYSGVAWCWSGQPDNIDLVTRWKSRDYLASDNAKTPSRIHFDDDHERTYWGYDIPPHVEPLSWFKLLLVPERQLPDEFRGVGSEKLQQARQQLYKSQETPVGVVAEYLSHLWEHAIEAMIRDRGAPAVAGCQFKVWITVPAIWDEAAQKRMREAAKLAEIQKPRPAGPTELELVAEPEAAALAVMADLKGRPDIQPGDVLVVCDAGGGTVDLISYEVVSIDPLVFTECVEGKGKMCGAIFIDEAFESQVKAALGSKWEKISIASRKALMNNEWEFGIKRQFDDSDRDWTVTVPPEAFNSKMPMRVKPLNDKRKEVTMDQGQLKFKRGHIRACFDAVLPKIRGLVNEQVRAVTKKTGKKPKAILLVGGLGSCLYLYKKLSEEHEPRGTIVLQPNGARPWTAICRGAVIRGISDTEIQSAKRAMVMSRISRVSYGVKHHTPFDSTRHLEKDREWSYMELAYKATNQMHWYLRRGDDILHQQPTTFDYYILLDEPLDTVTLHIYRNTDDEAPSRRTSNVQHFAEIQVKVTTPFEDFPLYVNSKGEQYRKLEYELRMMTTGTTMAWQVLINGEVVTRKDLSVEMQ